MATATDNPQKNLALTFASLLARVWLAVRAIQSGVEKFAGKVSSDELVNIDGQPNDYGLTASESVKEYALSHYHGVPEAMMEKFKAEPLMLGFGLTVYNVVLGPALILLGLGVLLGVFYRSSLFVLGLLYVSLTWGLILLGDVGSSGVAWLGTHVILVILALMLAEHNRLAILKKW